MNRGRRFRSGMLEIISYLLDSLFLLLRYTNQMGNNTSSSFTVTKDDVAHIAQLANLSVNQQEQEKFAKAFTSTVQEITNLQNLDTSDTEPTHHVTGLKNVWRTDEIDQKRIFSQEQATSQARLRYKGYFVVDRIIEEDM
jgi:aspartyl-tRNA(Asn)/glutamyl-tRNA(Gln) amidotransferase subunit C